MPTAVQCRQRCGLCAEGGAAALPRQSQARRIAAIAASAPSYRHLSRPGVTGRAHPESGQSSRQSRPPGPRPRRGSATPSHSPCALGGGLSPTAFSSVAPRRGRWPRPCWATNGKWWPWLRQAMVGQSARTANRSGRGVEEEVGAASWQPGGVECCSRARRQESASSADRVGDFWEFKPRRR